MQNTNQKLRLGLSLALFALSCLFMRPVLANSGNFSDWLNRAGGLGLQQVGETAYMTPEEPKDIRVIVADIVGVILGLLATIFLILIVVAGFKWMNSHGNSSKAAEAQKIILNASIGLLLILAAFAITIYITRSSIGVSSNTSKAELDATGIINEGDVNN